MIDAPSLPGVFETADAETFKRVDWYMRQHRALYVGFARGIAPDLHRADDVWDRLAFAILTANTTVGAALRAFRIARLFRGLPPVPPVQGIVPVRRAYVNRLPLGDAALFALLRRTDEPWPVYRGRLVASVPGLGLTKASYAACLLYPLDAEVACLDTWVQRVFLHTTSFIWLRRDEYEAVERELIQLARRHGVCLALAQWMVWDWVRGGRPTSQAEFFA